VPMNPANGPFRPEAPAVAELAAGTVLVRTATSPRVLLLHHRDEDRWCLPKGHVEPGESLASAAVRETLEETGLARIALGPEIAEVSHRFYSTRHQRNVVKVTVYFLASTEEEAARPEPLFDRFEWVEPARAVGLVPFENDRKVLAAARSALGP
jgi:8-oxo-dGTP pyrophosphatase MutT (NUDIX family)